MAGREQGRLAVGDSRSSGRLGRLSSNVAGARSDECIDCTLCVDECSVGAIHPEGDVAPGQELYMLLNAELAKVWPVMTAWIPAMPDAPAWDGKQDKLHLLIRLVTCGPCCGCSGNAGPPPIDGETER
jgi:NAD-dependent dihydropyrimidine dehydrogenase PreA subunit